MKIKYQWFFKDNIQREENTVKVPRHCKMEEHLKTAEFAQEELPHAPVRMSRVPPHMGQHSLLYHAPLHTNLCAPSWKQPIVVVYLFSKPFLVENLFLLSQPLSNDAL